MAWKCRSASGVQFGSISRIATPARAWIATRSTLTPGARVQRDSTLHGLSAPPPAWAASSRCRGAVASSLAAGAADPLGCIRSRVHLRPGGRHARPGAPAGRARACCACPPRQGHSNRRHPAASPFAHARHWSFPAPGIPVPPVNTDNNNTPRRGIARRVEARSCIREQAGRPARPARPDAASRTGQASVAPCAGRRPGGLSRRSGRGSR